MHLLEFQHFQFFSFSSCLQLAFSATSFCETHLHRTAKTKSVFSSHLRSQQPLQTFSLKPARRKEGNVLFNDALNTFYLRLYGVGHMVKNHSDSERGNLLPPHGLLFLMNSKGSFICIILI